MHSRTAPTLFPIVLALVINLVISPRDAQAGIMIEFFETVGGDVQFDVLAGGSLDLTGWSKEADPTLGGPPQFSRQTTADIDTFHFGTGSVDWYNRGAGSVVLSGDLPGHVGFFNSGNTSPADWAWGWEAFMTVGGTDDRVYVPNGYVSQEVLGTTQSFTWGGGSFATLGTSVGESWTATLGGTGDTITLTAVPEPSAAFLSLFPAVSFLWMRGRPRSRKRSLH